MNKTIPNKRGFSFSTVVMLLVSFFMMSSITSCGGGGGGGGGTPAPSPGPVPDTAPPAVISINPGNGTSGVAISSPITAIFSEAVDPATVNGSNFILNNGVTGTVTYDSVKNIAIYTPSTNLQYSTAYTVTITTGVKDLAGNPMPASYNWTFTTTKAPDTTPPTVSATNPGNGASQIIRNTPISVTFNEAIDCSTVTTNDLYFDNGVTGSTNCNGATVTFTPSSPLAPNTTYTGTITTSVKDLAGNAIVADYAWTFTTGTALAWAKSYSSLYSATSVYQTSDGGSIVAGYGASFTNAYAYLVMKVDVQGNVQWQKAYDGMGDFAQSIQQTVDGGYIVAGFSWNYGTGGAQGTWILKLDSTGTPDWQKSYSIGGAAPRAYVIRQTTDGGFIVAGEWYISSTDSDIWAMKLDSNGLITWQKRYAGGLIEIPSSIEQTNDGGYIVAGSWSSSTLGPVASVIKLDSNGNITWQMAYGDLNKNNKAASIKQTADGGYIVAGDTTSSGAGGSDAWIFKLDASGNIVWQKTYGGSLADGAYSVVQNGGGDYIVAGYTESAGAGGSDVWVLELDTNGAVIWQKTYGGVQNDARSGFVYDGALIRQATDGGYIIATHSDSFGGPWLLKITADGFIGFNPQSTAISGNTAFSAVDSNVNVGATSYAASDTSLLTAITNCPIIDATPASQQQAP